MTSTQLDARLWWTIGKRSEGMQVLPGIATQRFETRKTGLEVGGMLVGIVNPADESRTYRLI